ncbi:citrate synthase family protein [Caulobacter segnis]|uniref:citrate synthase family protein n=1 Tax=Caulobacter segnis TaxID=88688 RepID=UPI00240FB636|nr:citrate synthase family protein [Caulobacter segnis]MDG2521325.1 citrate synthase family protein [Caulobacter segnis]
MMEWMSAAEAMAALGVRRQTLYAYVSRGRIAAETDAADPRRSRYSAADVKLMAERKRRGRKAADVAQSAIAWGEPVLESAITTVAHGRLFYRGQDAVALAATHDFEAVSRLLRGQTNADLFPAQLAPSPKGKTARARLFTALATRAAIDLPLAGRSPNALFVEAASLLDQVVTAAAGQEGRGPAHERLAAAWGCDADGANLIRRALVLLADHELNASTFAARVAASTGASLAASALAGLAALSGPLHGGMASRVESFLAEVKRGGAEAATAARLMRGEPPPGFGHPLYPEGDPRALALLGAFETPKRWAAAAKAAEEAGFGRPNIDFALTALAKHLALPQDAPFTLFATARCAGWIAHAVEQSGTGRLIRPRARYVGLPAL